MQLPPLEVVTTWPLGDYTSPSRGRAVLALSLIFLPFLVILVALRTYTRLRLSKNIGADDTALLAAAFSALGVGVLTLTAFQSYGWGRHFWEVSPDVLELGLKYTIATEVLFGIACSLTKLSVLLFILRIMAAGLAILRQLSIAVIIVVGCEMFIFAIVVINTCSPVSDYWTLSIAPQKCINETAHLLASGMIDIFTNLCVLLISIPVAMTLRHSFRERMYCYILFAVGFIVCISGVLRTAYTYQLSTTYDKTWLAYPTWISGTVELYLGIITTSILGLKPFISRYFPRVLSSSCGDQSSTNGDLQSLEPHKDGERSKYPLSEGTSEADDIDLVKSNPYSSFRIDVTRSFHLDVENIPFPSKAKPVLLHPVVSVFSTYQEKNRRSAAKAKSTSPMEEWKNSHPPLCPPPPLCGSLPANAS